MILSGLLDGGKVTYLTEAEAWRQEPLGSGKTFEWLRSNGFEFKNNTWSDSMPILVVLSDRIRDKFREANTGKEILVPSLVIISHAKGIALGSSIYIGEDTIYDSVGVDADTGSPFVIKSKYSNFPNKDMFKVDKGTAFPLTEEEYSQICRICKIKQ